MRAWFIKIEVEDCRRKVEFFGEIGSKGEVGDGGRNRSQLLVETVSKREVREGRREWTQILLVSDAQVGKEGWKGGYWLVEINSQREIAERVW